MHNRCQLSMQRSRPASASKAAPRSASPEHQRQRPSTKPAVCTAEGRRMAQHWISEGAFAWSHRKFSLVQTFVCRMKRGGTGAVRKTPLMRVKDGNSYVLVGSQGGAPTDPVWVHNLRVTPDVEIRDETVVRPVRAREVEDEAERSRLWKLAIARVSALRGIPRAHIPVFVAERS